MGPLLSMNQAFIEKLNGILEDNYHNEHFGVSELAEAASISRSKLHRKLNDIKKISASEYIKLFRLEKAYEQLKNNTSTVSEIAYAVGFSSPSYFTKCFHEHYKFPPGELKGKYEESQQIKKLDKKTNERKVLTFKKLIVTGFLLAFIGIIAYFGIKNLSQSEGNTKQLSIAVLPFKNLSDDKSNQYFADGVMEVILSYLSGIDGFDVVSRTTMEQYRETSKTIPDIAKELNISYILEASIQKHTDNIRIVVQLIDAKNDIHIWADDYERPYDDIFSLQSEIAKEVAKQLELKLSNSSLQNIEKQTTTNFDAYNMYLKGRFFWHRRTEEDLKRSISYFEQAIDLDPNYALAYAGLADAYLIMSMWGWDEDFKSYVKGKDYALKALSIDDKLAPAYATLGNISTWFEWNWDQAEKELKHAISLDPKYATGYQYYAELLNVLGRFTEAREQIDLALKYNPNSVVAFRISANTYYYLNDFEKAIVESKKADEIRSEYFKNPFYFRYFIKVGETDKAFEHFKRMLPDSVSRNQKIDSIYLKKGLPGVVVDYINFISFTKNVYNLEIANFYALVGESEKALDYLEKGFEVKEPYLPGINHKQTFKDLENNPRFIALLEKMNLQ